MAVGFLPVACGCLPFLLTYFFTIASIVSLALASAYVFIINKYIKGWNSLPEWEAPPRFSPKTKVTVIIPARNEEENIIPCLNSILKINYPKDLLEIIVVDDHSTDNTFELINNFSKKNTSIKIIRLADFIRKNKNNSFKKIAIQTAIKQAVGDLIITTDADCIAPTDWLELIVSFYETKKPQFIAAPVNFHLEKSIFERFQSLDFLGMMGVTGAGIQLGWMNMCNGANLAYTKKVFEAVNGFEGIDHLASGDDILLMQKIAAHFQQGIGFLKNKNATVLTTAKPDINSFISQRLRWATKSANYREWKVTFILSIVFFYCCAIIFSFIAFLFFNIKWSILFLILFLTKLIIDYFFLKQMVTYFNRRDLMKKYCSAQVLHILYIVLIGFFSNIKKQYSWKGRKVK